MCGMGGYISSNPAMTEVNLARNIFLLNTLRGEDSAGMFDVHPKDTAKPNLYWQTDNHPFDFIKDTFDDQIDNRWKKDQPRVIGVHCRAATQGKIKKKNAHPFHHKPILGMHNGTITKDFLNRKRFETDSETIFYNICTFGLKDTLKDLQDKDPAFALVWMDFSKNTLNFIRNTKRPLAFVKLYSGLTWAWSSEPSHLILACQHAISYNTVSKPEYFKPHVHYSFDIDSSSLKMEEESIPEAIEKTGITYYGSGYNTNWKTDYTKPVWDTVDHWENEIGSKDKTSYAYTNQVYDQKTGKYYTEYQHKRLEEAREREAKKVVPLLPAPEKGESDTPFSMTTPSADKEHILVPFGPGLEKSCSVAEYRKRIKVGCACTGGSVTEDEVLFWIDDEHFLSIDSMDDIYADKTHWVRTLAYFPDSALERCFKEYENYLKEIKNYALN